MPALQPDNHDLSNLSALLAAASGSPAPSKPKKPRPIPANDNRVPDVLAWPTLERLARRPFSGERAISHMYEPLPGVEEPNPEKLHRPGSNH